MTSRSAKRRGARCLPGLAAAVLATCGVVLGSGEEPVDSEITERVEVVGTADPDTDVAVFSTRLDGRELAERGEDLADVLSRVPGARVRDYGGLGSYATLSLRASTAEQVTILVDGVPQNRALGGPVDLSSLPATQLERVTVFRGFAPAAYGLGGLGGVVSIRTRAPSDRAELEVDALGGELSTARFSVNAAVATGDRSHLALGLEALASDGDFLYFDAGETLRDPTDDVVRHRTNNDVEQRVVRVRHDWRGLDGGELQLHLRARDRERGVPGLGTFRSTTARLDEGQLDLTVFWKQPPRASGALELTVDAFRQQIGLRDLEGDLLRARDETTRLSGVGAAAVIRPAVGLHRLLLRFDLRGENAQVRDDLQEQADRGGADRVAYALTVEDVVTRGPWTVAPSVRWAYRDDDFRSGSSGSVTAPAADVREGEGSGKLSVAYAVNGRTAVRGSFGRFFRAPSLLELFGDRGSLAGNPDLRSESGLSAELGAVHRRRRGAWSWSGELVGFARRTEDLIHFISVSPGAAVAQNYAEVEVHGLEAQLSARWSRGLGVDASATLQRATDVAGGFADGKALPYQPEQLAYIGFRWELSQLRLLWDVTYTGASYDDALETPEVRIPARWIHDFALTYDARSGVRLGLDVRNVFDRQTRDLLRHPLPGRTVFVRIGWRWNGGST